MDPSMEGSGCKKKKYTVPKVIAPKLANKVAVTFDNNPATSTQETELKKMRFVLD